MIKPAFTLHGTSSVPWNQFPILRLAVPVPGEYLAAARVYVTSASYDEALLMCELDKDTSTGGGGGFLNFYTDGLKAIAPTVVVGEGRSVVGSEIRLDCGGSLNAVFNISRVELLAKRLP